LLEYINICAFIHIFNEQSDFQGFGE